VVGLVSTHFHDLRHTGNQFTAEAGANPKELMTRMGHDSTRAALIYLHSSGKRQRQLADAVGKAARAKLPSPRRALRRTVRHAEGTRSRRSAES
jgi:integrase